jgi:hypothetical protein
MKVTFIKNLCKTSSCVIYWIHKVKEGRTMTLSKKDMVLLRELLHCKENESLLDGARRMRGTLIAIDSALDSLTAVCNILEKEPGESVEEAAARVMEELKQLRTPEF